MDDEIKDDEILEETPEEQDALKAFTDVVTEELQKGGKIQLVGFGTFEISERAARTGRNPQTGEEMQIAGAGGRDALAAEQGAVVAELRAGGRFVFDVPLPRVLRRCRRPRLCEVVVSAQGDRHELDRHLHGAGGDRRVEGERLPLQLGVAAPARVLRRPEAGAHEPRLHRRLLAVPLLPLPQEHIPEGVAGAASRK